MTTQAAAIDKLPVRAHCARAAEWLAIAVAASLPWSTSATGILVVLWLVAVIRTLYLRSFRRTLFMPAAAIPIALVVLAVLGMTWGEASLAERLGSIKSFLRLLIIPLLFIQFRNSDRGLWVVASFLFSCTVLLALSWVLAIWPSLSWKIYGPPSVPFKDYVIQSGEFLICSFALAHVAISSWRAGQRLRALALTLLAFAFLANIVFFASARATLVVLAVLLPILAFQ